MSQTACSFVVTYLLVKMIDMHLLLSMGRLEQVHKVLLELLAVLVNVFPGILANQQHLTNMAFRLHAIQAVSLEMLSPIEDNVLAFETVLISHL